MQDDTPQPIAGSTYACITCGYDLSGSAIGGKCPECGTPVDASLRVSHTKGDSNSDATTCLVLGIVSIAACGLAGPFAIWMYYRVQADVRRGIASPSAMSNAKIGMILGWIGTALFFLGFCCGIGMIFIDTM